MPPTPPPFISVRRAATGLVAAALSLAMLGTAGQSASADPSVHATSGKLAAAAPQVPLHSDGKPRHARITIPQIDIEGLRVIAYRGKTDDAPGTRIQNRGIAAAPFGKHGGVGPGGIGNYQVTAHRSSHGAVFMRVPSLRKGDRVFVDTANWRYVYRIYTTRWVSFRSAKSLRAQRAPVPGKPGQKATRGYLTVSTCATPEDHAAGNYWHDRFGNPEHRIDKIGVLVKRIRR